MGRPVVNLAGQKFGRLEVVRQDGFSGKNAAWLCQCSCGNMVVLPGGNLRKGTQSCGCLAREVHSVQLSFKNTTHGKSRSRVYEIWSSMIARCYRPSHRHFKDYGGRGIAVCARWRESFENFLEDMGEPAQELTLDRYPDNDGNYEPGNCRWATKLQQANNTRRVNRYVWNGQILKTSELATLAGISVVAMYWRLKHWDLEKAISTPPAP